mmetsp:Transcript_49843/g.148843  ORF Transcript_49843/g.148843 Transcript_49843/m.148843 type:complete len:381 (-) Transcript_49843:290-1432(-)
MSEASQFTMQATTGAPSGSGSDNSTTTYSCAFPTPAAEAPSVSCSAKEVGGTGRPEVSKAASEIHHSDQPISLQPRTQRRYAELGSNCSNTERHFCSPSALGSTSHRVVSAHTAACQDARAWSLRYWTSKRHTGAPSGSGTDQLSTRACGSRATHSSEGIGVGLSEVRHRHVGDGSVQRPKSLAAQARSLCVTAGSMPSVMRTDQRPTPGVEESRRVTSTSCNSCQEKLPLRSIWICDTGAVPSTSGTLSSSLTAVGSRATHRRSWGEQGRSEVAAFSAWEKAEDQPTQFRARTRTRYAVSRSSGCISARHLRTSGAAATACATSTAADAAVGSSAALASLSTTTGSQEVCQELNTESLQYSSSQTNTGAPTGSVRSHST